MTLREWTHETGKPNKLIRGTGHEPHSPIEVAPSELRVRNGFVPANAVEKLHLRVANGLQARQRHLHEDPSDPLEQVGDSVRVSRANLGESRRGTDELAESPDRPDDGRLP